MCLPPTDIEDMDNESREMYESDVASLHRYFSKHLELPEHRELLTLLSQVLQWCLRLLSLLLQGLSNSLLSICVCLPDLHRLPVMDSPSRMMNCPTWALQFTQSKEENCHNFIVVVQSFNYNYILFLVDIRFIMFVAPAKFTWTQMIGIKA